MPINSELMDRHTRLYIHLHDIRVGTGNRAERGALKLLTKVDVVYGEHFREELMTHDDRLQVG